MDDTTKNMALSLAAGIVKKGLVTLSAGAVTHGIINSNQTETFVSAGMLLIGLIWSLWNDYGRAIILSQLDVLKAKSLAQAAQMRSAGVPQVTVNQIAAQSPTLTPASVTKTVATLPTSVQSTIAKMLLAACVLSMFLAGGSAMAAQPFKKLPPPAVTGDPIADAKTDLKNLGLVPAAGVTKNADGTVACNFNIFANLNPKNLIATVRACVSDANSTFEPDVAAALASAQAYNAGGSDGGKGDSTAVQCLQPALAIVQAGIQRPAVVAVDAQPATATSPAVPAVAAVPAYTPGPVTLFQKFREFVLAGGPSACQNWVNGTIQGATAPAVGAVAGVAGAAVLGGGL